MTDKLFEAVLLLENEEECYRFFEDICTVGEIKAMAQRLEVAKMLDRERTYTEIAEKTGASTATISRVKRCLYFGADGYRLILNRLKEKRTSQASGDAAAR
ncbi:MAG: YerC/YecD family TrpR-related protein [Peptococcaceae bacterium]|nr:YerC/YecD family TrpR-related protein [Peptococcaceae bacterium]MDH7525643.1 YerC/YecD family TrpR-related protein [Peptococcaceae bacterium]